MDLLIAFDLSTIPPYEADYDSFEMALNDLGNEVEYRSGRLPDTVAIVRNVRNDIPQSITPIDGFLRTQIEQYNKKVKITKLIIQPLEKGEPYFSRLI